jgi:hypothetical protein
MGRSKHKIKNEPSQQKGMDLICQNCGKDVPNNLINCRKCGDFFCSDACNDEQHTKYKHWCMAPDMGLIRATNNVFDLENPARMMPTYNNETFEPIPGPLPGRIPWSVYPIGFGPGKKAYDWINQNNPNKHNEELCYYYIPHSEIARTFFVKLTEEQREAYKKLVFGFSMKHQQRQMAMGVGVGSIPDIGFTIGADPQVEQPRHPHEVSALPKQPQQQDTTTVTKDTAKRARN